MKYMIATAAAIAVCIILGTAAAGLIAKRRDMSRRRKALLAAAFSVLFLVVGSLAYLETYYRAGDIAKAYLTGGAVPPPSTPSDGTTGTTASTAQASSGDVDAAPVTIQKTETGYFFDGPGESSAIIFYGGAKVEETAYAPLLYRISRRGADCFLVKAPFRFAFTAAGAADKITEAYAYQNYYLAGHSMGGVVASSAAAKHPDRITGLILLASYPNKKLPDEVRLLSIYGSEDGCLDRENYEKSRENHPADTQEIVIEGGNHAGFGDYGPQKGDGTALITPEEQWDETADAVMNWLGADAAGAEEADEYLRAVAKRSQSKEKSDPTLYKNGRDDAAQTAAAQAETAQSTAAQDETAQSTAAQDAAGTTAEPKDNPSQVSPQPDRKLYTIMIYMVGSNLESRMGNATRDIEEIDEAGLTFDNYNVVLYTGGSARWVSDVPSDCNAVLDMSRRGGERIVARTKESANMGDPRTLASFLQFCDENYPAEHNALILWDHGAGPLLGYGSDEIYDSDSLLLTEMSEAMEASPFGQKTEGDRKLDFVGFDACLMSCLESMEVWSQYADYYVASQELEPGAGWDYAFLKVLDEAAYVQTGDAQAPGATQQDTESQPNRPAAEAASAQTVAAPAITARILDTFRDYYAQKRSATYDPDLTLACVDLSKVRAVSEALDEMADRMNSSLRGGEYAEIMKRRADSKGFGLAENSKGQVSYNYDLVDMGDLADHMKEVYPQEAEEITAALGDAVVSQYTNLEKASGISLYFPFRNKGQYLSMGSYYAQIMQETKAALRYLSFLTASRKNWVREKARDWALGTPVDRGDEYTLQLTKEQIENSVAVYYTILDDERDRETGRCSTRVKRCRIEPDRDGVIHLSKSLPLIFAQVGDQKAFLRAEQIESDRKRSVYKTINVSLFSDVTYLEHRDDIEEIPITILFSIDHKTGDLQILNITGDDPGIGLGGKSTVEIGDWEELVGYTGNEAAIPTRDAEGRLLPFSEWNRSPVQTWSSCPIDSRFEVVAIRSDEIHASLVCQIEIEDINGEFYASELVELPGPSRMRTVETETENGTLSLAVYSDHAEVTGYTGTDDVIEVPGEVDGEPVTAIDGNFSVYNLNGSDAYTPVKEIILPDTITSIGSGSFSTCQNLEKIRMPASLAQIGDGAFMHCISLTEIEIPEGVKSIGKCAFAYCLSLNEIRIPESLAQIGDGVFMGCPNLARFTGAPVTKACRTESGLLYSADGRTLLAYSGEAGTECTVADGTQTIGYGAFARAHIREITFPDSVREVEGYAFYQCTSLAMPELPEGLLKVGRHAWDTRPRTLKDEEVSEEAVEIHIPASLEEIGEHSFDTYVNRRFRVADENRHYSERDGFLMNKAGDTVQQAASNAEGTVVIPEGTVSYSEDILWYYLNYRDSFNIDIPKREIYIPASVIRFEEPPSVSVYPEKFSSMHCARFLYHCPEGSRAEQYAKEKGLTYTTDMSVKTGEAQVETEKGRLYFDLFGDHAALVGYNGDDEELVLPQEAEGVPLTVIGNGVKSVSSILPDELYHFTSLSKIVIPEGVTQIKDNALCGVYSAEIILPSTLKVLGRSAIVSSKPVTLPDGIEVLGRECVSGVLKGERFVVRPSLRQIDSGAFNEARVRKFVQRGENARYSVRDGILFNADGTELLSYPMTGKSEVSVPEGVLGIGDSAFCERSTVQRIVLPSSLQYIGEGAFEDCIALTEVIFGEGTRLDYIGESAFCFCDTLSEITLPPVMDIGKSAFQFCRQLKEVTFAEGTLSIGDSAFYRTGVAAPVFPDSLQSIGQSAFDSYEDGLLPDSAQIIRIPAHVTVIGDYAFSSIGNTAFEVDEGNTVFSAEDGLLMDRDQSTVVLCPSGRTGTVTIPEGTAFIRNFAFIDAFGVTDVVIPDSVVYIGTENFDRNNVTFHCSEDSYAWRFALENGFDVE